MGRISNTRAVYLSVGAVVLLDCLLLGVGSGRRGELYFSAINLCSLMLFCIWFATEQKDFAPLDHRILVFAALLLGLAVAVFQASALWDILSRASRANAGSLSVTEPSLVERFSAVFSLLFALSGFLLLVSRDRSWAKKYVEQKRDEILP